MRKKIAISLFVVSAFFASVSFGEAAVVNCAKGQVCNDNKVGSCQYCSKTNRADGPGYYKGGSITGALCQNDNGCWVDAACWTSSPTSDFTGAVGNPVAQKVECCNSGDCLAIKGAGWACKSNVCTQELTDTDKALEGLGGVSPSSTTGCVGSAPANSIPCTNSTVDLSTGTFVRRLSTTDSCAANVACLYRCNYPGRVYEDGKCLIGAPSVQAGHCDGSNKIAVNIWKDYGDTYRYKLIPEINGAVRMDKAITVGKDSFFQGESGNIYNFRAYEVDASGNQIGALAKNCVNGATMCGSPSSDSGGLSAPNPTYPTRASTVSCSNFSVNLTSGQTYKAVLSATNANKVMWTCTDFECGNYSCNYKPGSYPMTTPYDLTNGIISSQQPTTYNNPTTSTKSRVCTFTVWDSSNESVKATCTGTVNVSPAVVSNEGSCGSANGKIYESEDVVSDSLCTSGASSVAILSFVKMPGSGADYFSAANWTCGAGAGMVNCSAHKKTKSSCGTANAGEYKTSIGTDTYCADGYKVVETPIFPSAPGPINWQCKSDSWLQTAFNAITFNFFNKEVPVSCSANKIPDDATEFNCGTAQAASYPVETTDITVDAQHTLCSGDSHSNLINTANEEPTSIPFGTIDNKASWTCINNNGASKTIPCSVIRGENTSDQGENDTPGPGDAETGDTQIGNAIADLCGSAVGTDTKVTAGKITGNFGTNLAGKDLGEVSFCSPDKANPVVNPPTKYPAIAGEISWECSKKGEPEKKITCAIKMADNGSVENFITTENGNPGNDVVGKCGIAKGEYSSGTERFRGPFCEIGKVELFDSGKYEFGAGQDWNLNGVTSFLKLKTGGLATRMKWTCLGGTATYALAQSSMNKSCEAVWRTPGKCNASIVSKVYAYDIEKISEGTDLCESGNPSPTSPVFQQGYEGIWYASWTCSGSGDNVGNTQCSAIRGVDPSIPTY